MAEIKIQEKKSSLLTWLIGLLLLAAIIFFVVYYMDNRTSEDGVFYLRETYNYASTLVYNLKEGGLYV
jgi:uncharacterized membrane protein YsdA (DUF1294 family)